MRRERKTHDEWEIQGDYGYGWEMLTTADTSAEAVSLLRDYNENDVFPHRIVKRRVRNER